MPFEELRHIFHLRKYIGRTIICYLKKPICHTNRRSSTNMCWAASQRGVVYKSGERLIYTELYGTIRGETNIYGTPRIYSSSVTAHLRSCFTGPTSCQLELPIISPICSHTYHLPAQLVSMQ